MNRRPWPIVLLAILQILSPVIYLAVASTFYNLSFADTAREIYSLSGDLRRFEIFVLPLILGGIILITRKTGYIVVIVGSVYLIARSILEFLATNQTDPIFPIVISNLICALVLVYFLRAKTREVYFNPALRWWETDPRYIVNISGTVTRIGGNSEKAVVENIAAGGAGVRTSMMGFLPEEVVDISFEYEGTKYELKSRIIWQRSEGSGNFLGLQWDRSNKGEHSKLRRMVQGLKAKGTPTTRQIPPWWEDFKTWLTGHS